MTPNADAYAGEGVVGIWGGGYIDNGYVEVKRRQVDNHPHVRASPARALRTQRGVGQARSPAPFTRGAPGR